MMNFPWTSRKKEEQIVKDRVIIDPNLLLPTRNFSTDIQALAFMIKHELTISLTFLQHRFTNVDIIREDMIKTEANKISLKIIESLSSDYAALLMLYYTEAALVDFITQSVMNELCKVAISKNKAVASGISVPAGTVLETRNDM